MDGPCIVGPFCDTYLQSYPHDEAVLEFQGASAGSYSMNSQPALIEPVTVLIDPLFNRSGSDVSSNTVDNLGLCDSLLWQPQQQQTTDQRMGGTWVSADCLGEDIPLLPPMGPLLTDLRSDPDLSVTVSNTSAAQHQHALKPGISELVAAAQSGPIIPYREPPCVPEPSAAPAADQLGLDSSICSSCSKLLDKGEELADSILAGSAGRVALNERIGNFILRAVYSCDKVVSSSSSSSTSEKGLARPCLFADREQLASPGNRRCWGLALCKARAAESGAKRARNGTLKPWNVNWNTNSPQLLSQQDKLLSIMGSGSSSGSQGSSSDILLSGGDSSGISSDASTAGSAFNTQQAPQVHVVRSADNKAHVIAYAVACYHRHGLVPPIMRAGAVPVDVANDLWGTKMKCSKKGHALAQKDLSLFKYAFVVVCA